MMTSYLSKRPFQNKKDSKGRQKSCFFQQLILIYAGSGFRKRKGYAGCVHTHTHSDYGWEVPLVSRTVKPLTTKRAYI
jgi:hypothetical protein